MNAARRLYLYGVAAISLLALCFALVNLVTLALARLGFALVEDDILAGDDALRRSAVFSVALALVTLPVWTLHWWLAERAADGPDEDDRTSLIRAGYLLAVVGVAFIVLVVRAVDLIDAFFAGWLSDAIAVTDSVQLDRVLAVLLVVGSVFAYHARIRQRDIALGEVHGAADWLGRLVVHAFALTGAWMLLIGTARLLAVTINTVFQPTGLVDARPWANPVASGSALALAGLVIWYASWTYSLQRLALTTWAGDRWRASNIRRGYLVSLGLAFTLVVMVLASQTIGALAARILTDSEDRGRSASHIGVLAIRALPFIAFAFFHYRRARQEAADFATGPERSGTARALTYATALAGIAFTAFGVAGSVALALNALDTDGGTVLAAGDGWRSDIARLFGVTLVGAVVWLWHWLRVSRTVAGDAWMESRPDAERHALSRRVYLLAVCGGAVIALFVSLASLVYRLLAALLDVAESDRLNVEVSGPLAIVIVALPLLAYHLLELRADSAVRPDAFQNVATTPETIPSASMQLILTGPSPAAVREVAATLSTTLPEGFSITIPDED